MKKLAKIFAVVLVCALAITALVACAPVPNLDYDKAKENLEKNGYVVTGYKDGTGDIQATLTGTNAKSGDAVEITWFNDADAANQYYEDTKKDFEDAKKEMQAQLDEMKAKIGELEGSAKEAAQALYDTLKEQFNKMFDNAVIGKSGNVVYSGTKAGIKATK